MRKITKEKVRHFDFAKKPVNPCFLMGVAKHVISVPTTKMRKLKLTKVGMEGIKGPYLLLVNHNSFADFHVMLRATHPERVNNVMTLEGFNTYTEPLMRAMGVLGTRKFITDVNLVRNIKYCLHTLKNVFVLFPEARYSLDGCTSFLPDSLGKMARMMNVPVVVLRIHGSFVGQPQWNKIDKGTPLEAEMIQIVTQEEARSLSPDEVNRRIREAFVYDDYRWQLENKVVIRHPKRAQGLHCLLYKCPACGTEHETDSEGTRLWCRHCGKAWQMDEYGQLHAEQGETEFSHIPDWSNWERQCVREEVEAGTYYFEDTVRVETLPGSLRFYKQGEGKLIQDVNGTRVICNYYGEPYELERTARNLESMHIEYDYLGRGDCVDISIPDDSFWCYLSKRDAVTKISFATEEIHKLALEKEKLVKAAR